ncbi:hypothetical protein SH528x_002140 [Novipirellula sp. SH528]|uniref:hypothetical protein n=1 Tax=Novipirellula sp. SH528 TaxID=3454466 RepID=UPI003F9F8FE1
MSYDLFLKSDSTTLTTDEFESYFNARPYYTLSNAQAFYENQDTGVYFFFDYAPDELGTVAFNLNYYRPHFFGLEAAPEVAEFISAFNLTVEDPQTDGMGDGPFSIDGFLRGWNAGNRFGYRAILSQDERPETQVYPTAELERTWRWNLNRAALQNRMGELLFVPKFMFYKGQTQARSAVVWPDACPIFMPKADIVIVLRDDLFNTTDREVTVVEWPEIKSVVQAFPVDEEHGHFRLDYEVTPDSVAQFIRALPIVPQEPDSGLAYDSVLNAELVLGNTTAG